MLVLSGHGKSYYRVTKQCEFKRNGSFVDIWFEDDGRTKWIGIIIEDLRNFLVSSESRGTGQINFDEPADEATALADFIKRSSVNPELRPSPKGEENER